MTSSPSPQSQTPTPAPEPKDIGGPWWKHPMVWLVIGGPLAVVIAGFATLIIAIRNPDEVLNTRRAVAAEADATAAKSALPAVEGRNHAVSPHVPGAASGPK